MLSCQDNKKTIRKTDHTIKNIRVKTYVKNI